MCPDFPLYALRVTNDDDDEEGEPAGRGGIRKYVGVAVNVRFAAGGEVHVMQVWKRSNAIRTSAQACALSFSRADVQAYIRT